MLGYILFAILIFGVLIFVHELGHFLMAKRMGVQVNEFAICMGPAIWKRTWGETTYSLRCIPLGGYCAMEGEDEESGNPRAFTAAKTWKRFLILISGSAMNFIAGLLILILLFSTAAGFVTPRISGFMEGSTISEETGLQEGDEFYRIDGKRVYVHSDISMLLSRNQTGNYDLEVIRDGRVVDLGKVPIVPRAFEENGQTVMRYGLSFAVENNSVAVTLRNSWYTAVDFSRMVWMSLGDLINGAVGIKDMSGPVGIVSVMAETGASSATVKDGVMNLAYFAAFLAVNLAMMNMLPIPALDGGRAFFLLISWCFWKITGKKLNPKYEGYIHAAGMILLLAFIAFITLKDIRNLF